MTLKRSSSNETKHTRSESGCILKFQADTSQNWVSGLHYTKPTPSLHTMDNFRIRKEHLGQETVV